MNRKILLANPRGFCAGVDRAIDIVEKAIEKFGSPIYVRHEVVHNKIVVEDLKSKGVIFVDELDEVPDGERVIFSAHGVAKSVEDEAEERNLNYFDATCPLVTKVHNEVIRHNRANRDVVLIGHAGHPEVEGTIGRHDPSSSKNIYLVEDVNDVGRLEVSDEKNIAYVTQTTLSLDDTKDIVDALNAKFPSLHQPRSSDICYATQNRQDAVKQLSLEVEIVIVVGSINSSNSNRLKELAEKCGVEAVLIDSVADINLSDLGNKTSIGVTAGASAPESTVRELVNELEKYFKTKASELGRNSESIYFKLPPELR
jgi:4-hydroxy-3-methylbut-2-enyl diphosphate reductase